MDKDQLDGLLALKLVAEKRNFTAAAEELGISPPAISRMIKQLEQRLGTALLSRTTRSTSLTEAGERFLNEAGPALDQVLTALERVGATKERPSGHLRINLPKVTYDAHIKSALRTFSKKYPDISIELFFEDQASDVVRSGFDAGIRLSDILAKDMVAVKIFGPVRFVVAGTKKYFERYGTPKHPKDLLSHDCIRFRFGSGGIYDRWEFERNGKEIQVQVKGTFVFNDALIIEDAALSGLGLMYIPEDTISNHLKAGRLQTVLDGFVAESTGYYLYYPQRSQVQPKLRAFIDHLKESKETGPKTEDRR